MFSTIIDGIQTAISTVLGWTVDILDEVGALGFIVFFIVLFVFTTRVLAIYSDSSKSSGKGSDKVKKTEK